MTAISFDYPGRRLLTGGHDGHLLKMWNFSNGALVKQFLKHEHASSSTVALSATSTSTSKYAAASASSSTSTSDDPTAMDSGSAPVSFSPAKRKVRDIMILPASFGIDQEGRRGGSMEHVDLPSPTKLRLERGHDDIPAAPREAAAARKLPTTDSGSSKTQTGTSSSDLPGPATEMIDRLHAAAPRSAQNRYRQQEVTSILDIERNLRVGMGDFICQRFVCSVGWDRNIFVWADKNDESEALPIHILPNKKTLLSNPTKCHSMDILALVYIPPAYIATAGLDGKILLWSLNSGEYVSKLHQSSGSIDTMCYAQKLELLFASGENGQLVCIDRSMTTQAVIDLDHPREEGITALRCDRTNTHLVTGDAAGFVKLWDLSIPPEHEGVTLEHCCEWRLGPARVLGADFIESGRVSELYLLLSCGNGEVSLWTLDGVLVGCFGKHLAWQLGRPTSYAASASSCTWPDPMVESPPQKQLIRCYSIASLNSSGNDAKETFLLEDSMPKPGEVWICVSGHRSRVMNMNAKKQDNPNSAATSESMSGSGVSSSTATMSSRRNSNSAQQGSSNNVDQQPRENLSSLPFLQHKLSENAGEITELITVIKVTRGEASLSSIAHAAFLCPADMCRCCSVVDFVLGWQRMQDARSESDRDDRLCAESRVDQANAAFPVHWTHVFVSVRLHALAIPTPLH